MTAVQISAEHAAFRAAIPDWLRGRLNPTETIERHITAAIGQGWTIRQLAAEVSRDLGTATTIGGTVTARLGKAAEYPPPNQASRTGLAKRPFCSDECRERAGLIEDAEGRVIGKCPCRSAS